MQSSYLNWITQVWTDLVRRKQVRVPAHLGHPRHAGFNRPPLAEPVGQIDDWVLPLRGGSRVHIHEFANGRLIAHLDRIDPERGPVQALAHWLTETRSGAVAITGVLVYLAVRAGAD
ncbi:MAG: hypothetical protein KC583_14970 [Myxococcales bacterium]|nr:hypothetical protein [Myxococcales bacterium]